ncbi:GDP-L-fucose synthase [Variibacter gotjawalensis]|uniref:GDP-L-fucose synthase n=1 Tax=Variibacter gotjawalensis TaxID=1333996 RepID=A0A0S3PNZ0_9BRAD|nr:GDP-L-fucose synthase [Variibacter gotjawalensis]NIK47896.1 GDP-L-fucose synthase [Variibacter gotjawalensis]RZS49775.1 GDP-L-fucose synthase [Variibacter gotjawalensis]BAT57603.1 GDP-L-fucose synthase [Variibacter gotjawalensis]
MIKVFVAGHRGLVGTATTQALASSGKYEIVTRARAELDLSDRVATRDFFMSARPDFVVMSAARVGGILANSNFPVEFLHENLAIQLSVFEAAHASGVKRMIFLGSSCIYPRDCAQPIKEEYLLTGPLEATNRPYALAKIAGVEACWAFNRQHQTAYLAVMPTNLYGPGDNYHPDHSHVLPALIRRFHEARMSSVDAVTVWGTGNPRREFMYSADMGNAIAFLLDLPLKQFAKLTAPDAAPLLNVGLGHDITIHELAHLVSDTVGFKGKIIFDDTKPDGTPRKMLDVRRLHNLGWTAKTDLRTGLHHAYNDFLNRYPTSPSQSVAPQMTSDKRAKQDAVIGA